MKFIDRTGEEGCNTFGTPMRIIECKNATNITIEFQDEYKTRKRATYQQFLKGTIKNPYDKEVYGVGYLGDENISHKTHPNIYNHWQKMLQRCYDPYYINKQLTYKDCVVCKEWHSFKIFAEWYEENYYNVFNQRMELDKDILYKGNKIYSPETCIFVPQRINNLFLKRQNNRGKYPIGVCLSKKTNKFSAQCSICTEKGKGKRMWLGEYETIGEAFYSYKVFKENYIKQVADEYKNLIPNKLYEALYKYEVEIND